MAVKFCGKCGNKMEEDQNYCGVCGWSPALISNPTVNQYENRPSRKPSFLIIAIILISAIALAVFLFRNGFNMFNNSLGEANSQGQQISPEDISGVFTGTVKVSDLKNITSAELDENTISILNEMKKTPSDCKIITEDGKLTFSFDLNGEETVAPPMEYEYSDGKLSALLEAESITYKVNGQFGVYQDKLTFNGSYFYSYPVTEEKSVVFEFSFVSLEYK